MTSNDILNTLLSNYPGTISLDAWGESSIFYNPDNRLPRGVYFATIKEKDGDNDKASQLFRDGVFRLNIGTTKPLFTECFGGLPRRPPKGGVIDGGWDFAAINKLLPHPVYGWMGWVSVNNPTAEVFSSLSPMLDAAYEKAKVTFLKRCKA